MTGRDFVERREFLRRGAVFGALAAGAVLGPWEAPVLASMSPPVALLGSKGGQSERLAWMGPTEVSFNLGLESTLDLVFQIEGTELFGLWNLGLVPPSEVPAGLIVGSTVSPADVAFTGGIQTKNVTVSWTFSGNVAPGFQTTLAYELTARPQVNGALKASLRAFLHLSS